MSPNLEAIAHQRVRGRLMAWCNRSTHDGKIVASVGTRQKDKNHNRGAGGNRTVYLVYNSFSSVLLSHAAIRKYDTANATYLNMRKVTNQKSIIINILVYVFGRGIKICTFDIHLKSDKLNIMVISEHLLDITIQAGRHGGQSNTKFSTHR
jgi:hypothetical protein